MNLLAIDAGNTRIKWGLHDGGGWRAQGWVPTAGAATLSSALNGIQAVDRVVVSNVAGAQAAAAIAAAVARYGVEAHWLAASSERCGVTSSYAAPEQLGTDRWAALIGARHRYAGPCLVVNAGTTMTVDALSADGVFLGGCIVPGLALMQDALDRSTAQLRSVPGRFLYFPDNTADAIMSGAVNALAGAVDRMTGYLQQTGEREPLIVLSGGAAETIAPHLAGRVERVDALVLEGLLQVGTEEQQEAQR